MFLLIPASVNTAVLVGSASRGWDAVKSVLRLSCVSNSRLNSPIRTVARSYTPRVHEKRCCAANTGRFSGRMALFFRSMSHQRTGGR